MRPLIMSNDIVVATKYFRVSSLHSGDLVVVELPPQMHSDLTVREIAYQTNVPSGGFYLRATSTNGLDSPWLGEFPFRNIKAKVIWIIK